MFDRPDLASLFASINPPSIPGHEMCFSAVEVPSWPAYRLAKDRAGRPVLLIDTGERGIVGARVELRNLAILPNARCQVASGGFVAESTLWVVQCKADDPSVQAWFLRAGSLWLGAIGRDPTGPNLFGAIDGLAQLMLASSQPPRNSVEGLWGELWLIAKAADPRFMLNAWHPTASAVHDFAVGDERVEAKTVLGARRAHRFSLEQLSPPDGTELLIASVALVRSPSGQSVEDLLARIAEQVGPDAVLSQRLLSNVVEALGEDWRQAEHQRFKVRSPGLAIFACRDVPTVAQPLPPEVHDVRFSVDLTDVVQASAERLLSRGRLFRELSAVQMSTSTELQ